jgi:hypothetical protein
MPIYPYGAILQPQHITRQVRMERVWFSHVTMVVPKSGSNYVQFKTDPNGYTVLVNRTIQCDRVPFNVLIIEDPTTITDGDAPVAIFNEFRPSTETCGVEIRANPTDITGGTEIEHIYFPSTNLGDSVPGLSAQPVERVLKVDCNYVLELQNGSDEEEPGRCQIAWVWYHVPLDEFSA